MYLVILCNSVGYECSVFLLFRYFGIIDVTDFDHINIYHFPSLLLVLFVFMLFLSYVCVHSAGCDLTIVGCFILSGHLCLSALGL